MATWGPEAGDESSTSLLGVLADERRRRLLSILDDLDGTVGEGRLASRLVATERECAPEDVPDAAVRARRLDLEHVHLPALAGADLIVWDCGAGTVQRTDHPAYDDPAFPAVVEVDAAGWDEVLAALADVRRRTALAALFRGSDPMTLADVTRAVADREAGATADRPLSSVRSSLHHSHLPHLDEAGLITYDADADSIAYEGHPELDVSWIDAPPETTPRPILPDVHRADDVWRLEGRSQVSARGRTLCATADDELFVLLTASEHLEDASLDEMRDAVDRGVDVYAGSQDASVLDRLRLEVPGATSVTLERDWLDPVGGRETVGRIVMSDRSAIMIGTHVVGSDPDGHTETAITATGEDGALVLLLRELLASRVDARNHPSDDAASGIPL